MHSRVTMKKVYGGELEIKCRIGTQPEALRCLDPVGSKHLRAEGARCLSGLENVTY